MLLKIDLDTLNCWIYKMGVVMLGLLWIVGAMQPWTHLIFRTMCLVVMNRMDLNGITMSWSSSIIILYSTTERVFLIVIQLYRWNNRSKRWKWSGRTEQWKSGLVLKICTYVLFCFFCFTFLHFKLKLRSNTFTWWLFW